MTYEEFIKDHNPIRNHLNPDAPLEGHMFETYGPEVAFVMNHKGTVWTVFDDEHIEKGVYYINRLGFLLTEEE